MVAAVTRDGHGNLKVVMPGLLLTIRLVDTSLSKFLPIGWKLYEETPIHAVIGLLLHPSHQHRSSNQDELLLQ